MKKEVTNQENKYYAVIAKCGHVRRNNYILIEYAVISINAKEAAKKARHIPRVKHDHKDAIRSVREISYEEFLEINRRNNKDLYLQVHSKQEQNKYCPDLKDRIIKEESYKNTKKDRKERMDFKRKKDISFIHEERNSRFYC